MPPSMRDRLFPPATTTGPAAVGGNVGVGVTTPRKSANGGKTTAWGKKLTIVRSSGSSGSVGKDCASTPSTVRTSLSLTPASTASSVGEPHSVGTNKSSVASCTNGAQPQSPSPRIRPRKLHLLPPPTKLKLPESACVENDDDGDNDGSSSDCAGFSYATALTGRSTSIGTVTTAGCSTLSGRSHSYGETDSSSASPFKLSKPKALGSSSSSSTDRDCLPSDLSSQRSTAPTSANTSLASDWQQDSLYNDETTTTTTINSNSSSEEAIDADADGNSGGSGSTSASASASRRSRRLNLLPPCGTTATGRSYSAALTGLVRKQPGIPKPLQPQEQGSSSSSSAEAAKALSSGAGGSTNNKSTGGPSNSTDEHRDSSGTSNSNSNVHKRGGGGGSTSNKPTPQHRRADSHISHLSHLEYDLAALPSNAYDDLGAGIGGSIGRGLDCADLDGLDDGPRDREIPQLVHQGPENPSDTSSLCYSTTSSMANALHFGHHHHGQPPQHLDVPTIDGQGNQGGEDQEGNATNDDGGKPPVPQMVSHRREIFQNQDCAPSHRGQRRLLHRDSMNSHLGYLDSVANLRGGSMVSASDFLESTRTSSSWSWPTHVQQQYDYMASLRLPKDDPKNGTLRSALGKAVHVLHHQCPDVKVTKVTNCGSEGKGTASRESSDLDLVVVIEDLTPSAMVERFPVLLDTIQEALDGKTCGSDADAQASEGDDRQEEAAAGEGDGAVAQAATPTEKTKKRKKKKKRNSGPKWHDQAVRDLEWYRKFGLRYTIEGITVDILLAAPKVHPKDFRKLITKQHEEQRRYMSASVSIMARKLIQSQCLFYKDMVRVVKDWRDSFSWGMYAPPKSYLLEILMLEACRQTKGVWSEKLNRTYNVVNYRAAQTVLLKFFDLIGCVDLYHLGQSYDDCHLPALFVCFEHFYKFRDIPMKQPQPIFESVREVRHGENKQVKIRRATAVVMDPVNPTNNLWLTLADANTLVVRAREAAAAIRRAAEEAGLGAEVAQQQQEQPNEQTHDQSAEIIEAAAQAEAPAPTSKSTDDDTAKRKRESKIQTAESQL